MHNKRIQFNSTINLQSTHNQNHATNALGKNIKLLTIKSPFFSHPQLWEVIQNLKTLPRHHYLIIRGKMGFGKSWLAIDACMDYAVIRSTDFQLFWLNVSKCDTPDGILRQMQTLKIMMRSTNDHTEPYIGPEYDNIQLRIIELKKYFQNTFSSDKYQNSLLVLCEVQNKEVIDAFDFHCKILATGRSESCFDEIPKSRKRFVVIDRGLTEQESLDFFDKLNVFDPQTKYRMKVREIHRLCQGEPMIISLISNNITQFSGRKPETRLANYIKQLRQNQLTDSQMESTIEESLSVLPEDDRQAYQRMVVFPKNIYVPISVLARYWQMNQEDTEALVDRLYRFSLLSVDYRTDSNRPAEESTIYVSMHYIYSSYLRKLYDDDEFKEMHLDICKSYETDAVLQRRTEPELFDLPDDGYIHYYIGYHLQRSGQRHLFPNFYFDFGFLEQKLRYTGLPNTRGDLEEYRSDIVRDDESKRELWNELLDFLPTIEEMVHQNNDTSLLQYALNASDTIAEEAVRQAKQFQNRVWFDDVGHPAKQRRQMVKLQRRPLVLKFYGPEAVIAALDDNSILLTDLSPSYVAEPTMLKEHTDPVHKLETFGNHYLISLDEGGTLLVWSLKDTPIYLAKCTDASMSTRSMDSSPGAQEDHMLKMRQFDVRNMNYRHTVDRIVETANLITCFKVHEAEVANVNGGDAFGLRNGFRNGGAVPQNKIRLFCGTQTGIVSCYEWCHKEEKFMSSGRIKTKLTDIRVLHFMAPVCLMVISAIHYQFMDMMNTAEMVLTSQWTDYPHPLAIYESSQLNGGGERKPAPGARIIYCVYRERIIRIDIQMIAGSCIHAPSMQEVYKAKAGAAISCSTQSEDGKYLVLGTEKGIVVFDCGSNTEWQRNSNGYRIACIDMCTCDDFNYRYLMISGTENGVQEVLNIYGLPGRKNVVGRTMSNDRSAYYGHSAKLIGDNQFEVIQSPDRELMIYAVETGNIVHMLTSADGCVEGHATIEGPWKKITCTGQWAGMFCFGTNDGKFFLCLPRPDQGLPEYKLCSDMRDAIVYIKPIDPAFCIVATDTEYIVHSWKNANDSIQQTGKIVDCFAVDDNGRMIIVREHAPVQLIEMAVEPIEARVKYLAETSGNVPIVGCEYQGETLALLDVQGKIRFFTVDKERLPEEFELVPRSKVLIQYRISAIALSKDATILAVGSEKGDIYVSIILVRRKSI